MQIGITQLLLPKFSTPLEFLDTAARTGYDAVELALRKDGDLTLQTSAADLQRIATRARELKLHLVSLTHTHLTGNLLDTGAARTRGVHETIAGLKIAQTLGITTTLHTLGRLRPDLYYEDAYANAQLSLRELAPHLESTNTRIAIEFVWSGFLFSPLEMRRFLDEVASPRIGFYFDPGNMAVFQFPQHWVRALGKRIFAVHLKDWKGRALNGAWTPLLQGEVDFPTVMRELRATGYTGPLISEVDPNTASLESTAASARQIAAL